MGFLHHVNFLGRCALAASLLVPLLLGVLLCSCTGTAPVSAPLELVVSGDTNGWITPCGCTANQSGGLLRRAAYLQQRREKATVLYADAGGAVAGVSPFQVLLFESILKGEREMAVVAHNLGGPEAALGAARLRDIQQHTRAPLLSANLRDADGQRIAPPLILASASGRRIAFVGVLSPRYAHNGLQIQDPLQAIRDVIAANKKDFDTLVILAYLPDDELPQLAASLPEADAVIGGPTGQSIAPRSVGPTVLAAATRKGKFLVHLNIPAPGGGGGGGWTGDIVELTPIFGDDPAQQQNVRDYLAALRAQDFASTTTGLVPPLADTPATHIAGSATCLPCHKSESNVWTHSGHAHAWQTLVSKQYEVDPSCQQCHTTGYGLPGGFVSAKHGTQVDVGCEDCHGPSTAHVANPTVHTLYRAADQCIRCHDVENSPSFSYASYWKKIAHGSHAAAPGGGERTP